MEDTVKKELLEMWSAHLAAIEKMFTKRLSATTIYPLPPKMDSQLLEEKSKKIEEPRTEILVAYSEIEAVEERKVETDSSKEQPKETNGNESAEKKMEEEESKPENGVSGEKEAEKEEPVEEERNDHEEEKEDEEKSKAENGVFDEKVEQVEPMGEEENNGHGEKKETDVEEEELKAEIGVSEEKEEPGEKEKNGHKEEEKELVTETDVAEHDEAKSKVEETGEPEIKESPVGKSKTERPLDSEMFEDQGIPWSSKGSPKESGKSYLQKVCLVCLLDDTCGWKLFLVLPDYELEGLGINNVLFQKEIRWTFDPGLGRWTYIL